MGDVVTRSKRSRRDMTAACQTAGSELNRREESQDQSEVSSGRSKDGVDGTYKYQ